MFRTMLTVISTWVVIFMLIGCANENDEGIARNEENVVGNDEPSSSASEFNLDLMTIIEHERSDSLSEDDHLSLEEAAHIGIEYILEFFEFDFEGTYMQLQRIAEGEGLIFNYNGPIWRGSVSRRERFNFENLAFEFAITGIDGEWVGVVRLPESMQGGYAQMRELLEKTMEELRELFPSPEEAEINMMLEVAREYAQRHFRNGNLHRIDYDFEMVTWLRFSAEDEYGQIIRIEIQRETHKLLAIY